MKKTEILNNIRVARVDHIKWVERARILIYSPIEVTKEQIPIDVTACHFGHWFYGEGQVLLSILSKQVVKNLDYKHKELHLCYMKIFKVYFDTTEESFLVKFLKKPKKITESNQHIAEDEFRRLENISEELVDYLNQIERNINHIDEEDLKQYH